MWGKINAPVILPWERALLPPQIEIIIDQTTHLIKTTSAHFKNCRSPAIRGVGIGFGGVGGICLQAPSFPPGYELCVIIQSLMTRKWSEQLTDLPENKQLSPHQSRI